MAAKTWKIEKDLCRCCHAEGAFDNLAEPRIFLEKEEIYSDMLRECLDIDIPPVPGELCAITYTICTTCITRLRDACNFKKQVQDCEQRFMTLYYKNAIQGIKPETIVKEEVDVTIEEVHSEEDVERIVKKEDDSDDDDNLTGGAADDDDISEDFSIKRTRSSTKPKPKPKPKAKPKAVKKEKPQPQAKKKPEPKAVKEKKGEIYTDYTVVQADNKDQYKCNTCEKCFNKRCLFAQHYKQVHLKLRPKLRACHLCEEKLPTHLRPFHMEEKHGLPAPSCGACGKKFAFPWQVLRHQKFYHLGESDYRCEPCNLTFIRKSKYVTHMIKHGDVRAYKCELCDKTFKWRNCWKLHMRIHNDVRNYVCGVCQEAFVQQSSLKRG